MANFIELIKKAAIEAVDTSKPVAFSFGVVVKENPLTINIEQKIELTEEFLILTNAVKLHETKINDQKVIIDNSLKRNEKVILIRMQGGQKFIVLDRV